MRRIALGTIGLFGAGPMFVSALGLSAQLTVGIGGGVVSSTLVGTEADALGVESSTGLSFGGFLSVPIANRVSVVPGIHYVQKGAKIPEPGVGVGEVEVSYVEIPVLISVSLAPPESPVGFSLFGGPSVSFEAGCTISAASAGVSVSVDCDPADQDNRQTTDVSLLVGAGVQFPVAESIALMLSGGADFGLRALDTSADPTDEKFRAFFGSVAVAFPVGG